MIMSSSKLAAGENPPVVPPPLPPPAPAPLLLLLLSSAAALRPAILADPRLSRLAALHGQTDPFAPVPVPVPGPPAAAASSSSSSSFPPPPPSSLTGTPCSRRLPLLIFPLRPKNHPRLLVPAAADGCSSLASIPPDPAIVAPGVVLPEPPHAIHIQPLSLACRRASLVARTESIATTNLRSSLNPKSRASHAAGGT